MLKYVLGFAAGLTVAYVNPAFGPYVARTAVETFNAVVVMVT
jgi:hypothetical protein